MKVHKCKQKKGLTLVEVIVTLAILSIVTGAIFSFFLFSNRTYGKGIDQYDVQSRIRIAADFVTSEVRYATKITILNSIEQSKIDNPSNEIDAYENYLFIKDGTLYRLGKYEQSSIVVCSGSSIDFSSSGTDYLLNFVIQGTESNQNYHIDSEVKPLNLSLEGIDGLSSGSVILYRNADDYLSKLALPEATIGDPTDPTQLIINFSKGILNMSIFSDNESTPASSIESIDNYHLRVLIDSPGVSDGREITFSVELDDYNTYYYILKFNSQWTIE